MAIKGAINVNQLAKQISDTLGEYSEELAEDIDELAGKIAKSAALRLRATSPVLTGSYATGWRASKNANTGHKWVVHNKTDYQLTHLLEKGHAKVGGGRVPANVHIAPVEKEVVEEFIAAVEEAIKR